MFGHFHTFLIASSTTRYIIYLFQCPYILEELSLYTACYLFAIFCSSEWSNRSNIGRRKRPHWLCARADECHGQHSGREPCMLFNVSISRFVLSYSLYSLSRIYICFQFLVGLIFISPAVHAILLDDCPQNGFTALDIAQKRGHIDIVRLLSVRFYQYAFQVLFVIQCYVCFTRRTHAAQ